MEEVWKDIKGFEGRYQVSNMGRIKSLKYLKKNASNLNIIIDDDDIYDNFGKYLCKIDDYVETFKLKHGCSFTSIYYCHGTLENILKCNKCGTVIFTDEDERYDPNLRCPTCTDYKTYFEYWAKEDIESDESKQDTIKYLKEEMEYKDFDYTPNLKRSISIIDPETAEEVKPTLYFDEKTNEVKGKCKLKPYKSYFAFEIREGK